MNMMFSFGKKKAPEPVKKVVPQVAVATGFANGLVGSDVEAPEFDPLNLAAGASPETINWYRAAELKVNTPFIYDRKTSTVNYNLILARSHLHACRFGTFSTTSISPSRCRI
jgi:hypothetical protein